MDHLDCPYNIALNQQVPHLHLPLVEVQNPLDHHSQDTQEHMDYLHNLHHQLFHPAQEVVEHPVYMKYHQDSLHNRYLQTGYSYLAGLEKLQLVPDFPKNLNQEAPLHQEVDLHQDQKLHQDHFLQELEQNIQGLEGLNHIFHPHFLGQKPHTHKLHLLGCQQKDQTEQGQNLLNKQVHLHCQVHYSQEHSSHYDFRIFQQLNHQLHQLSCNIHLVELNQRKNHH